MDMAERSKTRSQQEKLDWRKCLFCQKVTNEKLQCPCNNKRAADIGAGYRTLADNLQGFAELGEINLPYDLKELDDGSGVPQYLEKNKACWHKSCHLKYSTEKLSRARKRHKPDENVAGGCKFTRRSAPIEQPTDCFFCGGVEAGELRKASTMGLDARVRECALSLQDQALLGKLSAGDMVAQDAVYHPKCLATLYKKANKILESAPSQTKSESIAHSIALAELVSYIEDKKDDNVSPVFKLADLSELYNERLKQLGVHSCVHTTRLKNRIMAQFANLQSYTEGRHVYLAFQEDVAVAVKLAYTDQCDDDALCLAKAAKIIRRDIMQCKNTFDGSFEPDCQEKSVPKSVLSLVSMVLEGPNIKQQTDNPVSQASLTISQLLVHNSRTHAQKASSYTRHSKDHETPLPIYVGVNIHGKTRKRELIDDMFRLGLSVSYDRVLSISSDLANKVCAHFHAIGVVCPPHLRTGLFTVGAVDNIDHDPSSTTAKTSFHGTGMSLFQLPTINELGTSQVVSSETQLCGDQRNISYLPEYYANVPPVIVSLKVAEVPQPNGPVQPQTLEHLQQAQDCNKGWVELVSQHADEEDLPVNVSLSWSAYNASKEDIQPAMPCIQSLLPLFRDSSKSPAMIRHAIDVMSKVIQYLNPQQIPVVTADEPLYEIAKQIQWAIPEYDEKHLVVMLGGLHIELDALRCIGKWLEGSGWTAALTQANICTPGTADSLLKGSHVTKTRRAHQITLCALNLLLQNAYQTYTDSVAADELPMAYDTWSTDRQSLSATFHYWIQVMEQESLILAYVKSLREGNFPLYVEALTEMVHWMFALDKTNYSRWLPVHIRDMSSLESQLPDVHNEFMKGKFVVSKTCNKFSSIAIDQAHEQTNAVVKGDGGAVGITENAAALRRWMLSGPEISRLIQEFETAINRPTRSKDACHHEETKSTQLSFLSDVKSLAQAITDLGNPFLEEGEDFVVLDTKVIKSSEVTTTIHTAKSIGEQQYNQFVRERLETVSVPLYDTIHRNNFPLCNSQSERTKTKSQLSVKSLKLDRSLFSRLFVAAQTRGADLEEFFSHENQVYPPSLSDHGQLRPSTNKSDILDVLPNTTKQGTSPEASTVILDGAAIVHFLQPGTSGTFENYRAQVFYPYLMNQLRHATRVDLVWDQYRDDSLKTRTRANRGRGTRMKVTPSGKIPGNWQEFLKPSENKQELFDFLTEGLHHLDMPVGKHVYATSGPSSICIAGPECGIEEPVPDCSHEEADTRIFVHLSHAVKHGHTSIIIRTVDSDVVVLAVSVAAKLPVQIWLAFGTGKKFRYFPAHECAQLLGKSRSMALPFFHAFTGCDTVSSFSSVGKKTAWTTWEMYDEVTQAFNDLSCLQLPPSDENIALLERFVVLLYDRTSNQVTVNSARLYLFTKKLRQIENIPPTKGSLLQHINRTVFQAGYIWNQTTEPSPNLPSPAEYGWYQDDAGAWQPVWSLLPDAASVCTGLKKCSCRTDCESRCTCKRLRLKCTALCQCNSECSWTQGGI